MSNLRREFLQGAAAVLFLIPSSHPRYSKPSFCIGDKVADCWIDEFDRESVEYGEVCGICWHPAKKSWAYLIEWTGGGMPDSFYPCFDERLITESGLRLVNHA